MPPGNLFASRALERGYGLSISRRACSLAPAMVREVALILDERTRARPSVYKALEGGVHADKRGQRVVRGGRRSGSGRRRPCLLDGVSEGFVGEGGRKPHGGRVGRERRRGCGARQRVWRPSGHAQALPRRIEAGVRRPTATGIAQNGEALRGSQRAGVSAHRQRGAFAAFADAVGGAGGAWCRGACNGEARRRGGRAAIRRRRRWRGAGCAQGT
ncbi:hypothetical protein B0H14DRAFT_2633167 [Mycena olivaceomarginata]|nr:hypothetical protein B0H14DRAFT_2633167 [Mycena olivaceomarginata]